MLIQFCSEKGGRIVEINTSEENDLIIDNSAVFGIIDSFHGFWMGLNRKNGKFTWDSGSEQSWTNWMDGAQDGADDCTWVYAPMDYGWNNINCLSPTYVLCEGNL